MATTERTEAYLAQHNVQAKLENAVNDLLKTYPADPFRALQTNLGQFVQPPKPQVVFVLGGPGAGKGTQCARIVKEFGYVHLSAGDLLRDAKASGSANGNLIAEYIKEGKIVPVEITIALIKEAIQENTENGRFHFLVDGFPRNQENLEGWQNIMGEYADLQFVLVFDCPEEVMTARLLERGKTSGRTDDNAESIIKRFKTFQEQSLPVINHYQKLGKVRTVSAVAPPGEVYAAVQNIFRAYRPEVVFVLGGPGAGKGTQCANIVQHFGWAHLSAGDLLREERQSGSETAGLIDSYIKDGKIVPVAITIGLIKKAMEKLVLTGKTQFLVDGFPRNKNNDDGWRQIMGDWCKVKFVLNFDCPEPVMEARLLNRGKTSGRSDDNAESIKKRFRTFQNSSIPVIQAYKEFGLVRTVSSIPPPEEVWAEVRKLFLPPKPEVVFVLGGPGAGKGTQCANIVRDLGFVHLSAGDLLRAERASGSANGDMINEYIKEGKIVPVEVTLNLIKKAMEQSMGFGNSRFLIDGFPRNEDNDDGWHKVMDDFATLKFVLFFECTEAEMTARLLERGKTSGRADDNMESIIKRFRTFEEESKPIVAKYNARGMVRAINAMQDVNSVYLNVMTVFSREFQ